jgi:hypothetical protein
LRYFVAPFVAILVTCIQLGVKEHGGPWQLRAFGWWTGVAALDGVVGLAAVFGASQTGSGSAGDFIGWVMIGALAPLGLRSPVWAEKVLKRGQVKINPGITVVYDMTRGWLCWNVGERMGGLTRKASRKTAALLADNGWTSTLLLSRAIQEVEHRPNLTPEERAVVLVPLYASMGYNTDGERLEGLVEALKFHRLPTVIEFAAENAPDASDRAREPESIVRVRDFLGQGVTAPSSGGS